MVPASVLKEQARALFDVNEPQFIISEIKTFLNIYHRTSSSQELLRVYEELLTALLVKYSHLRELPEPEFLAIVNFILKRVTCYYLSSAHLLCRPSGWRCQLCSLHMVLRNVLAMRFTEIGFCWFVRN